MVSLAGDLFPPDERGRLFGFVLSGELIGGGFGIAIAGTLSGWAGWRPALAVLILSTPPSSSPARLRGRLPDLI